MKKLMQGSKGHLLIIGFLAASGLTGFKRDTIPIKEKTSSRHLHMVEEMNQGYAKKRLQSDRRMRESWERSAGLHFLSESLRDKIYITNTESNSHLIK